MNNLTASQQIQQTMEMMLKNGKMYTRQEIIDKAQNENNTTYSNGQISGAIKAFLDTHKEYASLQRGKYQKVQISDSDKEEVVNLEEELEITIRKIIDRAISSIHEYSMEKDPLNLTEEEFKIIKQLKNVIVKLEDIKADYN